MPNSNGSRRNLYFLSCVLFGCSKYVDLQTERREREREREREKRLFVGVYIDRYSSSLLDGYRLPICSRHREKKKTGQFRWIKIEAWSPGPGQSFSRKSTSFFLFVSLLLTHRDANKRLNIDTDHSRRAVAVNSWASMEREREAKVFPSLSFWLRPSKAAAIGDSTWVLSKISTSTTVYPNKRQEEDCNPSNLFFVFCFFGLMEKLKKSIFSFSPKWTNPSWFFLDPLSLSLFLAIYFLFFVCVRVSVLRSVGSTRFLCAIAYHYSAIAVVRLRLAAADSLWPIVYLSPLRVYWPSLAACATGNQPQKAIVIPCKQQPSTMC